ncbi:MULTISPECIES: HEAT repeat domain-containing protein [unclassified Legionella]|uniref:HEAT repeat domain-containing protein n=1 Tax=unclassified Legionella TaxID=2622702 RepID=UPI001E29DC49|nr:HEAT repeat domain-containing protein [Legionella sp. 31fI33]MCC5013897.1 HEAT repeat domain-containing protein [Legionella sp. 31fI33]
MNKVTNINLEPIVDSLYHLCKPSLVNLFRSSVLKAGLLKEIEEITDPNAIYPFIPLMFAKNRMVSKLANEKVHALLNQVPLHLLSKIDEKIRNSNFSKHYNQLSEYWYNLKPSIVDSYRGHSTEFVVILKSLCCHPNGYIRYKAIKTLAENSIAEAIPFLIIRANDWVEEIRILCFSTLNRLITKELIDHFIELLPLLKQLEIKTRKEHLFDRLELIRKIESLLASQCSDALFKKINSQEIIIARYAFAILAKADSKIEQLLTTTLNNRDIVIKVNAFNLAQDQYDSDQFLIYLNKIKDDKLMPIRKRVLYAFIERYPNQAKGILEQALLDRSRSIRHLSRYYLKQLGISEFSNYYRDAINRQDKPIKLAILGLSESGNKDDFRSIQPLISKNISQLNAAIIRAAFKMQPEGWKSMITHLLSNPDPASLKSFANGLLEYQESYTFEEILELVYKRNSLMHIRYFLRLLSNGYYDRWMVLNVILGELMLITDPNIKVLFEQYLHTWIHHNCPNKIFIRPCQETSNTCLDKASNLLKHNPTNSLYKELLENIKCFIN